MIQRRMFDVDPTSVGDFPHADGPQPTVSIILPMYNASGFVDDAIAHIEQLVDANFEVIIVDDGSKDDTWSRLRNVVTSAPLTLIRLTHNAGVAAARNIALRAARGTYVWMIDGDDAWPRDALAKLVTAAETSSAGMVVAQAEKLVVSSGEREAVTTPTRSGSYDLGSMVHALFDGGLRGHLWNKLFRRDLLGIDPFPIMRSKSDYCMIIRALPSIKTMEVVDDYVYEYRYQMGSITNSSIATPMDLLRCYEAAIQAKGYVAGGRALEAAFERFRYFSIAQIAYSEIWRYGSKAITGEVVREYLRGILTFAGLARLVGRVPIQKLMLALALKVSPGLVGQVYRRRRAHRWSAAKTDSSSK